MALCLYAFGVGLMDSKFAESVGKKDNEEKKGWVDMTKFFIFIFIMIFLVILLIPLKKLGFARDIIYFTLSLSTFFVLFFIVD